MVDAELQAVELNVKVEFMTQALTKLCATVKNTHPGIYNEVMRDFENLETKIAQEKNKVIIERRGW